MKYAGIIAILLAIIVLIIGIITPISIIICLFISAITGGFGIFVVLKNRNSLV